ncbi:unnamed protein product, partial [Chrysoparadoxa australica]
MPHARESCLITRSIDLIKGYDPVTQTVDSYADDQLGQADPDVVFLKQTLYGSVRYKEALRIFLTHYYHDLAASVLRSDYTLYMVLAYLLFFRIEELGFQGFQDVTSSQNPTNLCQLLEYVTNWEVMEGQVTQDWRRVLDLGFIQKVLLGGLKAIEGPLEQFCARLQDKAFGIAKAKEEAKAKMGLAEVECKSLTKPEPFKLTRPNPRKVPEPMRIDAEVPVSAEPTYLGRTSLAAVEAANAERLNQTRAATMKRWQVQKEDKAFRFHETRNTTDTRKREVEAEREAELKFDASFYKPVPKYPKDASVRLNASAILREDAVLKRKQSNDAQLLRAFEEDLRDSTEYYRWQTHMRAKDEAIRKEQVERKRLEAKQSAAAAKAMMDLQVEQNSELVHAIKKEKVLMQEQRESEKLMTELMNQRLVEEVANVRENAPREAQARIIAEKRAKKAQLEAEMAEALELRQLEEAKEARQRREMVLKLRGEEVKEKVVKVFNPTESAGLGLLNEMSLVEMHKRLEMNEERETEIEAGRRRHIVTERAEKQARLAQKAESIAKVRATAARNNRETRARRKEAEAIKEKKECLRREENNLKLMRELALKREARESERRALEEEQERCAKEAQFLGRASAAVEEDKFDKLLQGAEREAMQRQAEAQTAMAKHDKIVKKGKQQVKQVTHRRLAQTKKLYAQKAEVFEAARSEQKAELSREQKEKQLRFAEARERAKRVKDKVIAYNKYAADINDQSVAAG